MKGIARFLAVLAIATVAAAESPIPPQSNCSYTCFNAAASPKFRNYSFRSTQAACCSITQCPAGWIFLGPPAWGDPATLCN